MAIKLIIGKPGIEQMKRAKRSFAKLARLSKDLRPIFTDFLDWYKTEYVPAIFDSRGKALGQSWQNLSEIYAKKRGRKTSTLRLTDRLYNAAKGGSEWFEKFEKKSFTLGIEDSIPYAAAHQYGNSDTGMPQREYLFTRDDDLSPRAWAVLLELIKTGMIKKTGLR